MPAYRNVLINRLNVRAKHPWLCNSWNKSRIGMTPDPSSSSEGCGPPDYILTAYRRSIHTYTHVYILSITDCIQAKYTHTCTLSITDCIQVNISAYKTAWLPVRVTHPSVSSLFMPAHFNDNYTTSIIPLIVFSSSPN